MKHTIFSYNTDNNPKLLHKALLYAQKTQPLAILLQDTPKPKQTIKATKHITPGYIIMDNIKDSQTKIDTIMAINTDRTTNWEHIRSIDIGENKNSISICTITTSKTHPLSKESIINLVNLYIRPRTKHKELEKALIILQETLRTIGNSRTIIMGDTNATTTQWAPIEETINHYTNTQRGTNHYKNTQINRGKLILKFMNTNKLECINNIAQGPTYTSPISTQLERKAYIDIALTGNKAIRSWQKFTIPSMKWYKGHKIIQIEALTSHSKQQIHTQTTKTRLNKHENTQPLLTTKSQPTNIIRASTRIGEMIAIMNSISNKLYNELLTKQKLNKPMRRNRQKATHKRTPARHQIRMKKLQKTLKQHSKRTKNPRKYHKIINKIINNIKREQAYTCINAGTEEMNLWDKIKKTQQHIEISPDSNNNNNTLSIKDIIKEKFPYRDREDITNFTENIKHCSPKTIQINDSEIIYAIKEMQKKKHTGPEGLKFSTFNTATKDHRIRKIIITICKLSLLTSEIPDLCKLNVGKIIPKKSPGKFRIVHLSTPLSALIEQIILHRLEYTLDAGNHIDNRQYGFTPKRGRHDLISRMIHSTLINRQNKGPKARTVIVSLDILGAFDNVNHNTIIMKLHNDIRRDNHITKWIANFILKKEITLEFNNERTEPVPICQGVPQGSSLGPILWNFTINKLTSIISNNINTELLAYADDLILIHHSNDIRTTQTTIDKLINELSKLKLEVSPEKSSIMFIESNSMAKRRTSGIKIHGNQVEMVKEMNILGVNIKHNHFKLNTKKILSDPKLKQNILKLHRINTLGIINKPQEWQMLINAYIKSIIITNNFPILAIDKTARTKLDNIIIRLLKLVFNWPKNTSNRITRLILNQADIKNDITMMIHNKIHTEHGKQYLTLIQILEQNIDISNQITELKQDTNPTKPYTRIYADPRYQIKEQPPNKNTDFWTIIESKKGTTAKLIHPIYESSLTVQNKNYPTTYFNTLTLINELIKTTKNRTDLQEQNISNNILLREDNALLAALRNMRNHDHRIITTRDRLIQNQWQIIIANKTTPNRHQRNNHKKQTNNTTITHKSNIINTEDYKYKWNQRRKHQQIIKQEMASYITNFCKELTYDTRSWQQLNPTWISGKKILCLSGLLIRRNTTSEETKIINAFDYRCECNKQNLYKAYNTHRLLECPLYPIGSLNKTTTDIVTEIRDSKDKFKTINNILHKRQTQQTFLRALSNIIIEET